MSARTARKASRLPRGSSQKTAMVAPLRIRRGRQAAQLGTSVTASSFATRVHRRGRALVALFPFWWMLVTSLKRPVDIFAGVSLVPQHPTTANYSRLFDAYHMGSFLANSLIVVTVSVAASLVLGTLAAYALARFRLPLNLNGSALVGALLVRTLPPILLVIPLYITLAKNGLLNSRLGLIIVYGGLNT